MIVLPSNGQEGYNLTRSLRFRASASAYLSRTPASAGNRKTWTWSAWVKRGKLGSNQVLFISKPSGTTDATFTDIAFSSSDTLLISGLSVQWRNTTQVFRDPSAWYHIVVTWDTTQATASNRVKVYVNGSQVTAFGTTFDPSLNFDGAINQADVHAFCAPDGYSYSYFDGYMTEVNFIDGQALTPSSFGSTNSTTGVWQPAKYTGTYGTNGFYLPFTDNSALTTSSNVGLGKDFSGNGNYWTTNNISITAGTTYDSMTDVPTLTSETASNFCVGNPLSIGPNASLSNGNLSGSLTGSGGWAGSICGLTSGKWYYETTMTANSGNSAWVGFLSDVYTKNDNAWSYSTQTALYANDGRNGNNASYGATWTTNDVIGIAIDLSTSSGSVTFYKNGVSQGVMFSSLTSSAVWRPLISGGGTGTTIAMNFGQRSFTYTPPSGFVALNTYNLPDSTIKQGNKVMDATLYTGTLLSNSVVNAAAFKPDLVWVKSRSAATNNELTDSVRGVTKALISNVATAETTDVQGLTAFNTNGFTVGTDTTYNNLTATYVAWQWQAGAGSTSINTNGTITSTVSVNVSAGFSIVAFNGTGANGTVGHGLGVAPKLVIARNRLNATSWPMYSATLANASQYLYLVSGNAAGTTTGFWNSTAPTSSVFSVGIDIQVNQSGSPSIAYCWAEIDGFSKIGSYSGNGSTDGPFVYCGFLPKFVMFKSMTSASNWNIYDTSRNTYNVVDKKLYPNLSNAEASLVAFDALSNGFKLRSTDSDHNGSGQTYMFAAFASNPFKNSLAR